MSGLRKVPADAVLGRRLFLRCLLLLGVVPVVALVLLNRVLSGSVDFAHHYALVAYLQNYVSLPVVNDPALYVMSYYPPAAHIIAAIFGRIVGSPLLGMQLVGLMSLALLWGAVGIWFSTLPTSRLVRFALFAAALLFFAIAGNYELHGWELIGHFLFSQLVAQAAAFCLIAAAACCWQAGWSTWRVGVLMAVLAPLVAQLHLLPGLAVVGTLAVAGLLIIVAERKPFIRGLALAAGLPLLSGLTILLSPAFRAMRKLSENNGNLPLNFISSLSQLSALGLVVLALSVFLGLWWILRHRQGEGRANVAVALLAAYGVSLALLCFAQFVVLLADEGSDYAVRKYAFGLQVVLLLQIGMALAILSNGIIPAMKHPAWVGLGRALTVSLPAVTAVGVVLSMFTHATGVVELSRLVRTESFLTSYHRLMPTPEAGKSSYAIDLPTQPTAFDYMFSIGVLRAPAATNGFRILRSEKPDKPEAIDSIFTAAGSPWDASSCRRASSVEGIAVVDARCVFAQALPCEGEADLSDAARVPVATLKGFSAPWAQGRWTVRPTASITCVGKTAGMQAQLFAFGFVPAGHKQRLIVSVDGVSVLETVFNNEAEQKELLVPLPADCSKGCKIGLSMPDAKSPAALGVSADTRSLGVGVRRIVFKNY